MTTTPLLTHPEPAAVPPDRRVGHGKARFLADKSGQLDIKGGTPALMVPKDHLARLIRDFVDTVDTSSVEKEYSSLGRRAIHPKGKLGIWLYASLIGMHHASEVARAVRTDLAFRLLSGGHDVSATTLCAFRRENGQLFAKLNQELVHRAVELGLVDPEGLATDSMRLRADASMKQIRTKVRSEARLKELAAVSEDELDGEQLKRHREKVEKHRSAVENCGKTGRTNYLITNSLAGLMKFPNGASMPGHRLTVTAAGTRFRFILSAQVGFEPTDHGLLGPAVLATREVLVGTKLQDSKLQVAADPGYIGPVDLAFALENRAIVDILIHNPPEPRRGKNVVEGGMYSRDEFIINEDGSAICPAGKPMQATPCQPGANERVWRGVGCTECPVQTHCTTTKSRRITMDLKREVLHDAMRTRMALPGAKARYNKRIAIIEPVFSYLEDTMRYVRATSRLERTVRSEVSMKILAYNLARFLLHVWIFLSYGCARTAARLEAELRSWVGGEGDGGRAARAAGDGQRAAVVCAA